MRHTRRDTADIEVSSSRILPHDRNRPRNHLRRDRLTIKVRSQALKDNPALREHNERHEKSVGELLMEKFFIKDKKLNNDKNQQIRLYRQISLDRDEKNEPLEREALQKRVTRRFTRRRSTDLQLDPEQLRREATYAQVQAKVLDNLVAEEQAQIENEVRCGTLIRKGTTINCSYYINSADSDTMTQEEEEAAAIKIRKVIKKAKKKKKSIVDITDDVFNKKQSSTSNNIFTNSRIEDEVKPQMYKIEACNSVGDFSTIWMNANIEKEKCKLTTVDELKVGNQTDGVDASLKSADKAKTEIVLPVQKSCVKNPSKNSVYLTMKKPDKLKELENLDTNNDKSQVILTNGFTYATENIFENDKLESLPIKNTASDKIADKIEFSVKKNDYSPSNEDLRGKQDIIVLRAKSDVQDINIEDALSLKSIETATNFMQSSTSAFVLTNAQQNNVQVKHLSLLKDTSVICSKKDINQQNENMVDSMKTNLEVLSNIKTVKLPTTKDFSSNIDKFVKEKKESKVLTQNNANKNNANSTTLAPDDAACRLPKGSKINVDRNNTVEAPELSLRETEYLANLPKSAEDVVITAVLPGKKANKASNFVQIPSTDSPKKANDVDVDNKSTFNTDASQHNNAVNLETKKPIFLKETNSVVSINDEIKKDINIKETLKNNMGKSNKNISCDSSLQLSTSSKKMEVNIETLSDVSKESKLLKVDIKKSNSVLNKNLSSDSELSNFVNKTVELNSAESKFKIKTLQSKTVMNEISNVTDSKKVGKNLGISKIIKVNDSKLTSLHKKDINTQKILKKNVSIDSLKPINEYSSNLTLSNPTNFLVSQQPIFADKKDKITSIKKTLQSSKPLDKVMENKFMIDANCKIAPLEDGQLSKSASTESIDFWNEIKTPDSSEMTMINFKIEQETNLTIPKGIFNDSPVKESDNKKNVIGVKASITTPNGPVVKEEPKKEKVALENLEAKKTETMEKKNCTIEVQKIMSKKKIPSIAISAKDSNLTVKKMLKRDGSANSTQSELRVSKRSSIIQSVPIINIVETSKSEKLKNRNIDDEHEDPSTPTNELLPALFLTSKISQYNQNNLTNADDVKTPNVSEESNLIANPSFSPQSSKTKCTIKKKKLSSKKMLSQSIKNNKETKKIRNNESMTITNQQNIHKSSCKKHFLAKPSTKSPKSSPRNSPSQRPLDLIRMFYTTPSALLTATPRDLSKVRRVKIKRRWHHSRTSSVNSDSTGSTTSTATTESTDDSTCIEMDEDAEHKRINSTRSNDSGFDGSPRISSIYFIIVCTLRFYHYSDNFDIFVLIGQITSECKMLLQL